jgi:DNA polymerase-3 subunit alpha
LWACTLTRPFSTGDGLNRPEEHIDFAIQNEMDALALTDHGNMNGYSHQYLYYQKLKKAGNPFKALAGIEAYFVPSLSDWQKLYDQSRNDKQEEKLHKRIEKLKKSVKKDLVGDEYAPMKEDLILGQAENKADEELEGDTGVENEEDSKKSSKTFNPLYQRNHLVLLPKNNAGLKTVFSWISNSYINGFYKYPRMDYELLKSANGNVVALSACVAGYLSKIVFDNQIEENWENYKPNNDNFELIQRKLAESVGRFQEVFGKENYFVEIQFNKLSAQHLANYHLIECAKRTGAQLVVTADSHYARPDYWREREVYRLMSRLQMMKSGDEQINLPKSIDELKCELYPKNAQQIWDTYLETGKEKYDFYDDSLVCDAIERTHDIAHNLIGSVEPDCTVKLPSIKKLVEKDSLETLYKRLGDAANEDDLAFEQLKRLVVEGARWRNVADKDNYIDRLKEELSVIKTLKFSKYFLTYNKIMKLIGQQCLTGPGRGSAAGSLVAYVLDITQIDPIKNGLLFERFLTRTKSGFPDIDSDVSDRDKALELLNQFFGEENVIAVSNFNQLQMRSLIKDLCRLSGVPFAEANIATKQIETETKQVARQEPGFDAAQWFLTYEAADRDSKTFRELLIKYPEFEKMIKVLFKNNRNISRHAGGVIITNNAKENMPIVKSGGVLQTPWTEGANYRHLETFGFLKFDVLGLGTLRMFESCIRRILVKQGNKNPTFNQIKSFYYDQLHPDNNNMDDMKVYKNVYWESNYAGIFQFVRDQVQRLMAQTQPTSIEDIAVITSLYRPGPLSVGADKIFLKNRANPENISYKHPLLKEVLSTTAGLIIFQEQLQLIYHKLAGVPLEETDNIRKAFTKKEVANKEKAAEERQKLKSEFVKLCKQANNIAEETSGSIFDEMEQYVKYSFNKSHAVSYATVSYQCAWLQTYYPDEWIATYIDYCITDKGKVTGFEDPKAIALSEAKKLGYKLAKPDINISDKEFVVRNNELIPSFSSLKSVGVSAQYEIYKNRPYRTIEDLLWDENENWKHSRLNKRALSNLIKMNSLDSMELVGEGKQFSNNKQLHYVLVDHADDLKRAVSRKKSKNHKELLESLIKDSQQIEDWNQQEKVDFSKELIGLVDSELIITPEVRQYLDTVNIESIDNWEVDGVLYWAIVDKSSIGQTKKGKKFGKMILKGDSAETYPCFIWNINPELQPLPNSNTLIIGKFKKTDFGLSTFYNAIQSLTEK